MKKLTKASNPFYFHSRLHLRELTGLRASNLSQLLHHIKTVPGSVIYNHTHHFLEQHERVVPSVSNDFAYWVTEVLGESRLGEQLSTIDTASEPSIRTLRDKIADVIEKALTEMPSLGAKTAPSGEEFYFMKITSFVFMTKYQASDLQSFAECLDKVAVTSLYYHIFESRLRHEKATNDMSAWLSDSLGEKKLADEFASVNPYDYSLERMRKKLLEMVKRRLGSS